MNINRGQRGQALILIVLEIVGLVAITALAIDAGNSFSDRCHAQNAADTAALAGALRKAQEQPDWSTFAYSRATSNGYPDSTVTINNPPVAGCNGTNGPYVGDDEYIQVIIRSTVYTFFAPIVGINQLNNCVESIARAQPTVITSLALGSAVAAVSCDAYRALNASGNADVILIGGGAFSNSNNAQALYVRQPTNLVTPIDKGLSAVGGIKADGYPPPVTTGLQQFPCPLPDYMLPEYTCNYNYVDFPPAASDANVTWAAGVARLNPGVYCISGSFPKSNLWGEGVTIVMLNQGISWQGNVNVHLIAPTSGSTDGLLIYLPYSNSNEIRLNGTAGLDITGSVFAPDSNILLLGDFGNQAINSQWVGKTVDLSGSINAIIQYDSSRNFEFSSPPEIELTK